MKIIIMLVVLFFVSFINFHNSVAGILAYTCEVTHVYEPADDSSIQISNFEKQMKGSQFSVSRVTGEIVGEVLPTLLANSTKVINKGNKEYSFKALAYFDAVNKPFSSGNEDAVNTANVQLLEIQEFRHGDRKPFIAMSMTGAGIITGFCK